MSAFCAYCEKIVEPRIEEVKDYEEFQGSMWFTGNVDEIEVCPDCHNELRLASVVLEFETEAEIPF